MEKKERKVEELCGVTCLLHICGQALCDSSRGPHQVRSVSGFTHISLQHSESQMGIGIIQ